MVDQTVCDPSWVLLVCMALPVMIILMPLAWGSCANGRSIQQGSSNTGPFSLGKRYGQVNSSAVLKVPQMLGSAHLCL